MVSVSTSRNMLKLHKCSKHCPPCQARKNSQAQAKSASCIFIARWSISSHPRWHCWFPVIFELVHSYLDLYLFVFKLAYLVPLSDTSSKTVVRKLMDSWISMFGVPQESLPIEEPNSLLPVSTTKPSFRLIRLTTASSNVFIDSSSRP